MRLPSLLLAVALATPLAAQKSAQKPPPMAGLATAGLAGQSVALLPLTMVVTDSRLPGGSGARGRAATLRWADSLLADLLTGRATEVQWLLPDALRRTADRSGGLMPSPDRMGQAILRAQGLREVPDPLRGYLRQLVAFSGGARFAFVPAALYLSPAPGDSLVVQLSAVLADARLGRVVWRTLARGKGETADEAYRAALDTILPPDGSVP